MPRHCVFCSERKLTWEDIWPRWFKKWLRSQPQLPQTFSLTYMRNGQTTVIRKNFPTVGGKRRIACERCNGRLGNLQNAASKILKPMLNHPYASPQVRVELVPTAQTILAAWAVMTSMTSEFLGWPLPDNDETRFTQTERVQFRRTLRPLRDMDICSTQYVGPNATGAFFAHSAPPILDYSTNEPTGEVADLLVVTLCLFHVCFQVAFWRDPDTRFASGGQTVLGGVAAPAGVLVPIWPAKETQQWPAGYSVGEDTFEDFCRRWDPVDPQDEPRSPAV